jgi:hypothetical protein
MDTQKEQMMFNALVNFETLNTKKKMFALLDVAEQILEHDVTINGLTLDDAELNDADAEDAFEELRGMLHKLQQKIEQHVE